MKNVRILYLLCLLSPVSFLFGYLVGAPKQMAAPRVDYGGVDNRHVKPDAQGIEKGGESMLVDESLRLSPNRDFMR